MRETAQNPMRLLTPEQRGRLLANDRLPAVDHVPVFKFFGTWFATELDEDGDTWFGLADLGVPQLGSFGPNEVSSLHLPSASHRARHLLHRLVPDLGLRGSRPAGRQHHGRREHSLVVAPLATGGGMMRFRPWPKPEGSVANLSERWLLHESR